MTLEQHLTTKAKHHFRSNRLSQKSWWYLVLLANEGKL
jgi:hypothetical protein